ncbi:hypothetical protein [Armatimonas rosea]|uniref:Uncharacterized protein n=1 Tax=Armatimonas rosea TaxID=685828 RepID=A0A7W9SWG0_ARMRO|nr:hypothetical protein [Armatimonas rosea]MBB6054110.1 hypothetical protein [Armatimonas rosea]
MTAPVESPRKVTSPADFLAECRKRGIKLAATNGTIKATGRPPARPDSFAKYLQTHKEELLSLLTTRGAGIVLPAAAPTEKAPADIEGAEKARKGPIQEPAEDPSLQPQEAPPVATPSEAVTASPETASPVLESVLYPSGDGRGVLLAWAISECQAERFPEPVEPIKLFNGETTGESASDWLLVAFRRASCLAEDDPEFLHLRQSMKELAIWGADCVRWKRLTVTHRGAASPWVHGTSWPAESGDSDLRKSKAIR